MDIGHNDINGVLHMPYDEMIAHLPPVIVEIKKAIEVNVTRKSYYITSTSDDLKKQNRENTVCK
jgi:hypothetical protein